MDEGGGQVQYNIVLMDLLKAEQKAPENYRFQSSGSRVTIPSFSSSRKRFRTISSSVWNTHKCNNAYVYISER